MKKYLSILLLIIAGLATSVEASRCGDGFNSRRQTYSMNIPGGTIVQPDVCCSKDCDCFPTVFQGFGSTLLGQETASNGGELPIANPSFLEPALATYNAIHNCPSFAYNDGVGGQGSTAGRSQVLKTTNGILWGGSDSFNKDQNLLYFPVVQAGVVVFYTPPMGSDPSTVMTLTKQQAGDIFSGDVTDWSSLATTGPAFPAATIVPVTRFDGSGTTDILLDFLSSATGQAPMIPVWNLTAGTAGDTAGGGYSPATWGDAQGNGNPNGNMLQAEGTSALINTVLGGIGRIGYAGYNNILDELDAGTVKVASIQNNALCFVAPSTDAFSAALNAFGTFIPCDLKFSTVDPEVSEQNCENADSQIYPIATPSYIVVRPCQFSQCQAFELRKFLYFLLAQAQAANGEENGFGPVDQSYELVQRYVEQISCIESYECNIDNQIGRCGICDIGCGDSYKSEDCCKIKPC